MAVPGLFLREGGFDGGDDFGGVGLHFGIPAVENCAIGPDQEFAEVPFDVTGEFGFFAGEVGVEGMLLGAFDVDFFGQREGDMVGRGAKFFDLFGGAGFLGTEIVAGHAEDGEAFIFVFFLDGFELFVLGSEAAFGGDVDEEDDFAGVGAEAGRLAVDVFDGDFLHRIGFGEKGDREKEGRNECGFLHGAKYCSAAGAVKNRANRGMIDLGGDCNTILGCPNRSSKIGSVPH